MPVKAVTQLP